MDECNARGSGFIVLLRRPQLGGAKVAIEPHKFVCSIASIGIKLR